MPFQFFSVGSTGEASEWVGRRLRYRLMPFRSFHNEINTQIESYKKEAQKRGNRIILSGTNTRNEVIVSVCCVGPLLLLQEAPLHPSNPITILFARKMVLRLLEMSSNSLHCAPPESSGNTGKGLHRGARSGQFGAGCLRLSNKWTGQIAL